MKKVAGKKIHMRVKRHFGQTALTSDNVQTH